MNTNETRIITTSVTANSFSDYRQGIANLKKCGYELKDQSFAWDLWEKGNNRFFVKKDF